MWLVRALLDDLWPSAPTDEDVCGWAGQDLILRIDVEDIVTGRTASEHVTLVASIEDANGPFDCSAY